MNEEFITKLLAELFDFPCNFSPCEEELHNSEENCVWCEEHCNKCDAADCWMHYFEVKFAEKGMSVDTLIALTESVDEQLSELPQRRILQDREAAEEKLRELERYPSKPCFMCVNARVDDELTDDNDFSSIGVGRAMKGYRLSINSGNRSPVSIKVEAWNEQMQRNTIVASYHPKFCPNCGRRLFEYEEVNENERRNDS